MSCFFPQKSEILLHTAESYCIPSDNRGCSADEETRVHTLLSFTEKFYIDMCIKLFSHGSQNNEQKKLWLRRQSSIFLFYKRTQNWHKIKLYTHCSCIGTKSNLSVYQHGRRQNIHRGHLISILLHLGFQSYICVNRSPHSSTPTDAGNGEITFPILSCISLYGLRVFWPIPN